MARDLAGPVGLRGSLPDHRHTGLLIAVGLMVVGFALLGVVTASIAAWFVQRLKPVEEAESRTEATLGDVLVELRRMNERLEALEGRTDQSPPDRRR